MLLEEGELLPFAVHVHSTRAACSFGPGCGKVPSGFALVAFGSKTT